MGAQEEQHQHGVNWKKCAVSLGRHGGFGGGEWDDGVFSFIKTIEITYDSRCIISIKTEYCDHDRENSSWSNKNGGNDDKARMEKVQLDCPNEYLISIHGCMDVDYRGHYLVVSLTFESNLRSYGPFGKERGDKFWFPTTACRVVGFHGASGWYLDSIGIKVVPIQTDTNTTPS